MEEYEYSFKVKNIKPYVDYAIKNGFKLIGSNKEIRDLYTGDGTILARITTREDNIVLDFKSGDDTGKILHVRKESLPLSIKKKDLDTIKSIIDVLGYKQIKHLVRERVVYEKGNVRFEIDDYKEPEVMKVVAVEGSKEEVDKVYELLKEINDKEQLHEKL